jgi:hydroxymethylpyrimidine/phosphomethylpyrimidine kinase
MLNMPAVALTIAGSDPSGGAGIQADLKTFHQFGVYGEAVVTLLTVQNTQTVSRVHTLRADLVIEQIQAVIADIPPAAAKTGALGNIEIIEAVAALAESFAFPLIADPVMVSKHGARLLAPDAEAALRRKLLPRAFLVTPNLPEAEALTGLSIRTKEDMQAAAQRLFDFGCPNVLIKGGHLPGQPIDLLYGREGGHFFEGTRIETRHTHGTGCAYSAAITAGLALGRSLWEAVSQAKEFVQRAIETAPGLGAGNGPLNFNTSVPTDRPCRSRP